jgi:hypothetical protein
MKPAETLLDFARWVMDRAWADLPPAHRTLLKAIRADEWAVTDRPLGKYGDDLRRSAGYVSFSTAELERQDSAAGLWIPELRLVIINLAHRSFAALDRSSLEYAVARVAWHEWGHALAFHQATEDDVAAGSRLLDLAPAPLAVNVRAADYRQREYTHEIVAEVYALLLARRRQGVTGRPPWLHPEIHELVRRVVGWNR